MTEHEPKIIFSDIENKIDYICEYIRRHMPDIEIAVANHAFDEFIPEGITFILPKGAVVVDGEFPIFEYRDNQMMVKIPELLFRMPELTFRIDKDGTVSGMGDISKPFVDKLNKL